MTKQLQKKTVELKKMRIPLRKLLHGFEIREASENLKNFRLKLLEEELMQGAKLTIKVDSFGGDFNLIASRLETDKEFETRIEKARLAAEAKKRREAERKAAEAKRAAQARADELIRTKERLLKIAVEAGISKHDLVDFLRS
jgi:hypothetical protein